MSQAGSTSTRVQRRWLIGSGLVGLGLGVGLAAWRFREDSNPSSREVLQAFWSSEFQTLSGASLGLAAWRGRPLLLNFWATWCPPCVEELPLLDRFYRDQRSRGWNQLALAIDQAEAVQRFLQRQPLEMPVALAGAGGTGLSRSLGNLAGGLPFTVVFDSAGGVVHRKMGQVRPPDLESWRGLR